MTLAQRFEEKGMEKGLEKAAKNLLSEGMDPQFISKVTNLPVAKIKELQKNFH